MATITLNPSIGFSGLSPTGTHITVSGGFVFALPFEVVMAKITNAALSVRLEPQSSAIQGSGRVIVGTFGYSGSQSIPAAWWHLPSESLIIQDGVTQATPIISGIVTASVVAAQNYMNIGVLIVYEPLSSSNDLKHVLVNYGLSTLTLTYEDYTLPAPTNFTPSSGSFSPGEALNTSWEFKPSGSPLDGQTGSVLDYNVNNTGWTSISLYGNYYTFAANTFSQGATVKLRAMTKSLVGESPYTSEYTLTAYSTKPPNTLSPNNVSRNPGSTITCSWQYVKSDYANDSQTSSILRYRIASGAWNTLTLNNKLNTYTFPARTFSDGQTITWQIQTISNVGTSDWSAEAKFALAITPPLVPVLIYPVETDVSGADVTGVSLQWIYNSEYDKAPSRFDITYRIDKGIEKSMSNTGQLNAHIPASEFADGVRHVVDWKVKAYGEFGDPGEWSDTASFWTVGLPGKPTIVDVTNSNLPTVYFSASNLLSWELQIIQNGEVVYWTGGMPFNNVFFYKLTDFLPDGNYVARMRISNEYGLYSAWGELAFTINVEHAEPPRLRVTCNTRYYIRLAFDNAGQTVYVYRAKFGESAYERIAKTTGNTFDDYTVSPGGTYCYFIRALDDDEGYTDSNIETGLADFKETALSSSDTPGDMLLLSKMYGAKPTKNATVEYEKTLTHLLGRRHPVLQMGEHKDRRIILSFYCSLDELAGLEALAENDKPLLLRDWRYGAVYGVIEGGVNASISAKDGYVVSFTFTQTDYEREVALE